MKKMALLTLFFGTLSAMEPDQLLKFCYDGDLEGVKAEVEKGVDINKKSVSGNVAIVYATTWKNWEITKFLVSKGADVNKTFGGEGFTALQSAVRRGNQEITKLLLDHGANPNTVDMFDRHPLIIASEDGNLEIVKLLVNAGADINYKSRYFGKTPLSVATKNKHDLVVDYLKSVGAWQR